MTTFDLNLFIWKVSRLQTVVRAEMHQRATNHVHNRRCYKEPRSHY